MEKKMLPSTLVRDWTLIKTANRRAAGPKRNSSHSALVKTPERYNRHDDEEAEHGPAHGNAQPPLRQLRQPEVVGPADNADVIAAIDSRAKRRQPDYPPRHGT